jgi:hypothetical protein
MGFNSAFKGLNEIFFGLFHFIGRVGQDEFYWSGVKLSSMLYALKFI